MATSASNFFEIQRRGYQWNRYSTLDDGITSMLWDNDPNAAVDGNSAGETKLVSMPAGSMFFQSSGILWLKTAMPNTWIDITSGGGTPSYQIITKEIAAGSSEIFYSIDLTATTGFEYTVKLFYNTNRAISKVLCIYNNGLLENNEFGIIGHFFQYTIQITKSGNIMNFSIQNNESYNIFATVKQEKL